MQCAEINLQKLLDNRNWIRIMSVVKGGEE